MEFEKKVAIEKLAMEMIAFNKAIERAFLPQIERGEDVRENLDAVERLCEMIGQRLDVLLDAIDE